MKTNSLRLAPRALSLFGSLLFLAPHAGAQIVVSSAGGDPASILGAVDTYRTVISLGGANNGNGGAFATGRREINWDAPVLDPFQFDASKPAPNPVNSPADFFNNQVRRGLITTSPDGDGVYVSGRTGSLNGDGSANADVRFSTANATYATQFQAFSQQRLFSIDGGLLLDITFRVPGSPGVLASVNGFGAVFTDVDLANLTTMSFYGAGDAFLGSFDVPEFDQGLSFLGVAFDDGTRVERVQLSLGNLPFEDVGITETPGFDVVVLDDFIYGEPQALNASSAVPEPSTYGLIGAAALGFVAVARRRRRQRRNENPSVGASVD